MIMAINWEVIVDAFINNSDITSKNWCSGVSDIMGVVFSHSFGSYVSAGHRGWARGFCDW